MFEDTKWVIPEAVNRRMTYNQIDKRQEDKQMTYKTHRKLKIEQHELFNVHRLRISISLNFSLCSLLKLPQ
jgi:hypothetical protein